MYDAIIDAAEGDFVPATASGANAFRSRLSGSVSIAAARAMLDPLIREYAKLKGFPETNVFDILDRLAVEFEEVSSELVVSRGFTFDTSATLGAGNVGDGTLNRLTVGKYGKDLEAVTPELKSLRCIADVRSGTDLHQERFEIRGADVPRDFVAGIVGPNRIGAFASISADTSESYVSNPSFSRFSENTLPVIDGLTDWTPATNITNFEIISSDTYRTAVHEGDTPYALRFKTNDTITQNLSVAGATLFPNVPYYVQIAYKRESSADGNLTLTVGSNAISVVLSAQTGWNILRLALDENLFLRGFNQTTNAISIALASNTTGDVLVDDIVFGPMALFDGTWWAMVGGQTPALVGDTFEFTDTATESINQKWFWRVYGKSLPHGTPTWLDAT